MASVQRHPSSFRDPSGFVFYQDGVLYRQVNKIYRDDFERLYHSGLFERLVKEEKLVPSQVVNENLTGSPDWFCTLQPEPVSLISYPYEWCFAMLKDAALLTLDIMQQSMAKGMVLKDATPYNVQWHKGKMTFIDTLSFERYDAAQPWIAYRQFCESFLLPLALMHYNQVPLSSLLLSYPEGIPLPVGSQWLPWRSKLKLNDYLHLHLNARVTNRPHNSSTETKTPFTAKKLANIIRSLKEAVSSYQFSGAGVWTDYYSEAAQRDDYVTQKQTILDQWLTGLPPVRSAIDVGANEGLFSELLAKNGVQTIAADLDHASINRLYQKTKATRLPITPLLVDFSNPSPAIGVNNKERLSLLDRVETDLVLALAVVHHLAIGKNIPFDSIAQLFRQLGRSLVVEFIPKNDPKIQDMLQHKKDVYFDYSDTSFRMAFAPYFRVLDEQLVGSSGRTLFLMTAYDA